MNPDPIQERQDDWQYYSENTYTLLYPSVPRLEAYYNMFSGLPSHTFDDLIKSYAPATYNTDVIGLVRLDGLHVDIVFVDPRTSPVYHLIPRSRTDHSELENMANKEKFSTWAREAGPGVFLDLHDRVLAEHERYKPGDLVVGNIVVSGEWCGKDISSSDMAISRVDNFFVVESIRINGMWVLAEYYKQVENVSNRIFHAARGGHINHEMCIHDICGSKKEIRRLTKLVQEECPFAKCVFDEVGKGKGIIWKTLERYADPRYWFETTEVDMALSRVDKLPRAMLSVQNANRVRNFAEAIVTDVRLEQIWDRLEESTTQEQNAFVGMVCQDCFSTEQTHIEEHNMPKESLEHAIKVIAGDWFKQKRH